MIFNNLIFQFHKKRKMEKTQSTLASSSSASFGTAMPSTSKPSATPITLSRENPKPNPNPNSNSIIQSQEDLPLSRATHLTRPELLRRRSHCLKQLSKCYKDHYWALMEELKSQYRRYCWEFGSIPFQHQQPQKQFQKNNDNNLIFEGSGENVSNKNKNINNPRCLFVGCKLKAMALTSFCHLHILSDSKQKLYKPCDYVIKRYSFCLFFFPFFLFKFSYQYNIYLLCFAGFEWICMKFICCNKCIQNQAFFDIIMCFLDV